MVTDYSKRIFVILWKFILKSVALIMITIITNPY